MKDDVSYYFYRRAASYVHISKLIPALEDGENKLREISKSIGMTYTNLSQAMQDAHKEGLINRKRINNTWEFELTDKGRALCELCKGLRVVIEQWDGENTLKFLSNLKFGEVKTIKKSETSDVIRKPEVVKSEEKTTKKE